MLCKFWKNVVSMERKEIADVKYVTYFTKWLITRGEERKETRESKRDGFPPNVFYIIYRKMKNVKIMYTDITPKNNSRAKYSKISCKF